MSFLNYETFELIFEKCLNITNLPIKKNMENPNLEKYFEVKKRNRTVMSPSQSKVLKNYFLRNMFPSTEAREELAKMLGMKPRTIQIWFQNMRQKNKNRLVCVDYYDDDWADCKGLHALAEIASNLLEKSNKDSHIQR